MPSDITVACPQALWDHKNASLTEKRRHEILSGFDAIVVDEAQFAVDRYRAICQLAPLAFKFCITATPMAADGTLFADMHSASGYSYKNDFFLLSAFDVSEGNKATPRIYKELLPFKEGLSNPNGVYIDWHNKSETYLVNDSDGEKSDLSLAGQVIKSALDVAKGRDLATGYLNQVMVKVSSINRIKALLGCKEKGKEKKTALSEDCVAVYGGAPGASLGDPDFRNPFMRMLSKEFEDKLKPPSDWRRGALCVQQAQIGGF
jgi:hypothetical protein